MVRSWLPAAHLALTALALLWNMLLTARIGGVRAAPRSFSALTSLSGLLVAPALLIAVVTASGVYGRPLQTLTWVWPVTLALFAAQAIYATARRLVTPLVGVPIAVYDVLLLVGATTTLLISRGVRMPVALLVYAAAQRSALGLLVSDAALWSPLVMLVPVLSPAFAPRWRASAFVRGSVAAYAVAWSALTLVEVRTGLRAIQSYSVYAGDALQERPVGDFIVGLHVFPTLTDPPTPAVVHDLDLADSLGVGALHIAITPEGTARATLDSLARLLEDRRRAGTRLIVSIGFPFDVRTLAGQSVPFDDAARLRAVERVARRLRPDYLLPVVEPYGAAARTVGRLPVERWRDHLTRAADVAHRVDPRIRVGVALSATTARDSSLYAWASSAASPLDAVGFSFLPGRLGALSLDVGADAAGRWMRTAQSQKEHWVFSAGGFALVHGELSQERAIIHAMAWATAQPGVRGIIVSAAGDYGAPTGLRAPDGHLRRAASAVQRSVRALREQ